MLKSTNNGTFLIQILDQQHSTWQGTITWIYNNEQKPFRSEVELLKLIGSSLEEEQKEETQPPA